MSPQEKQEFNKMKEQLAKFEASDRYTIQKLMQMFDGRNFQLGKTTGSQFGTESTQKIGFLGKSPVSQQSKISDPSGGGTQDSESRTAINSIIDVLEAYGFNASS